MPFSQGFCYIKDYTNRGNILVTYTFADKHQVQRESRPRPRIILLMKIELFIALLFRLEFSRYIYLTKNRFPEHHLLDYHYRRIII